MLFRAFYQKSQKSTKSQVTYLPECFPSCQKKQILFQKHFSSKSTYQVQPTNVKHTLCASKINCCCPAAVAADALLPSPLLPRRHHRCCPAAPPPPLLLPRHHRCCPATTATAPPPSLLPEKEHRGHQRANQGVKESALPISMVQNPVVLFGKGDRLSWYSLPAAVFSAQQPHGLRIYAHCFNA